MPGIVLDSSALVAILRDEPEAVQLMQLLSSTDVCLLSSVSLLETSIVLAGTTEAEDAWLELDALLEQIGIEVVPMDAAMARIARTAFLRYGKGRHPAALNFGDCASYALARSSGYPLLYKGNDFTRTDLPQATHPHQ